MNEVPTPAEWTMFHAWEEVQHALDALQDDFDGKGAGPSGLRAQAMAHLRQALALREQAHYCQLSGAQ